MDQHEIMRFAKTAEKLIATGDRNSAEAFILAWIAWEGLKNRILVVGLAHHGWQRKDSEFAFRECALYSRRDYTIAFEMTFGKPPAQMKSLGKVWNEIEKCCKVPDSIVHGGRLWDPKEFKKATQAIVHRVTVTDWVADARIQVGQEQFILGNPFNRIKVNRTQAKSSDALIKNIQGARNIFRK